MVERLRQILRSERVRRSAPWLIPLGATLGLSLLLSPGLTRLRQPVRQAAAPPTATFEQWPASESTQVAALSPPAALEDPLPSELEAPTGDAEPDLTTRFDCIIEPHVVVKLGSPVTGVIESLHADRSDFVETGQVIAQLESGAEQAAADLSRARAKMQGTIKAREASVELGERRQDRVHRLFERNTLSLDLREQVETEAEIARRELLEAVENQRLASLELRQALEVLRRRTIRSPISGVVVERLMAPGEVVIEDRTILTIAKIDPLRVEVILPSALYGSVKPGMRAAVEPEFGDQVHVASVTLVDRVIDAASGTFGARLELPNPDHAIPGGLHCQVHFLSE